MIARCAAAAAIFAAIFLVYLPFSGSPAVFDDHNLFANQAVFDYAQNVFSREPRTFPYFTIGFVHVLARGDLGPNRVLNSALHALVIAALFCFLRRATRLSGVEDGRRDRVICVVCLWVAINPLAVYAIGYLIQRTIVFATLFGIVSVTLYLRAQQEGRRLDLVFAALMAGLAMMSKEHAVLWPLAAVALTPLCGGWGRERVVRAGAYLALALPCMLWVTLHRGKELVGNRYEIYSGEVLAQFTAVPLFDFPGGTWLMSAGTQMLLFWKYLVLWLVPNPAWMSVDVRVDFPGLWSSAWAFIGVAATLLLFAVAAVVWCRPRAVGRHRSVAAVLIFAAIAFAVELSVVRIQEPMVLYRSYLWMPAFALMFCMALLHADSWLATRALRLPRRVFWLVIFAAGVGLVPAAQDRLQSFSSEDALWRDAAQKLSRPDVAGADRIYYNLAGEAFKRRDFNAALQFSDKVVVQNPSAFQGYLAKGASLLALNRPEAAMLAFDTALLHQPPPWFFGYIEFKRCGVIEARGERDAVIACLRRSAALGYEMARFRLKMAGIAE